METNTARNPLLDLPTFTKYLQNRLGKSYLPGPFSSEGSGVIKTNFYRIVPTCARDPLVAEIEITSLSIKASIDLTVLNATTLNDIDDKRKKPNIITLGYNLVQNKRLDSYKEIPFP